MAGERIFLNSNEIRECASKISIHDGIIMELLSAFEAEIRNVEAQWGAEASYEMKEAFQALKPSFEKFHRYNEKVVSHLRTNVAEARDVLDEALRGNASNLRRTI